LQALEDKLNRVKRAKQLFKEWDRAGYKECHYHFLLSKYNRPFTIKQEMARIDDEKLFAEVGYIFDDCPANLNKMPQEWYKEVKRIGKKNTNLVRYLCDVLQNSNMESHQKLLDNLQRWC